MLMSIEVVTSPDHPELHDQARAAFRDQWPEFVYHDDLEREHPYAERVETFFRDFHVFLLQDGNVVAGGWGVSLAWDGRPAGLPEGYRSALVQAFDDHQQSRQINTLSFMAAAVSEEFHQQGLAVRVLKSLIERASAAGLAHVIAPIRPTWKDKYPQVSMAEYATWERDDGFSIDPWIRTHQRMGATIIKPAPNSIVVSGTVAEWEAWTGMPFPISGSYFVPGALNLVEVDRERDTAIYREENLWVQHR
jgi:GNAT superfamily N-acetyltransferase